MKDKNIAALLSIFLGFLGIHRFYLGQVGLGIFYCILMFTGISFLLMFIDFVAFLAMDQRVFDAKYNRDYLADRDRYDTDYDRTVDRRKRERSRSYEKERPRRGSANRPPVRKTPQPKGRNNSFKISGLQKYKDYEFEAAIVDFKKALQINPNDVAVHFNMACTYSLVEEKDNAFFHLSKSVELGFVDFEKIRTHDALAYLRIQDEFDQFVKNGYRLSPKPKTKRESLTESSDLLEQLRKLGELREKGLLTQDEFAMQKKKLLG